LYEDYSAMDNSLPTPESASAPAENSISTQTKEDYSTNNTQDEQNLSIFTQTKLSNSQPPSTGLFESLLSTANSHAHLYQDYSISSLDNATPELIDTTPPAMDNVVLGDTNFYNLIAPQLNHLFDNYPRYPELEKIVHNTQWIKVSFTDNGEGHYILGKLYDDGVVTYLCYGIPSPSRLTPPPADLIDYCQWLPLDLDNVDGEGYWVMYQSAETGHNFRL
ncbi:MAG: hypothetical protein IKC79_02420, partial [Clostridia bacterium]|nr:hypothetical protein [Clostridia bacterium]